VRIVWLLALNQWQENVRSRFHVLTLVFSVILVLLSLIFGVLAVDQEQRVILDFGLSFIELLSLAGALYGAASGILREMETKTIYLVLTRPVSRGRYLFGRYLGLLLSAGAAMGVMSVVHLGVLFLKGWSFEPSYFKALAGIFLKVGVTAALGVFLAIFSSSVLTALIIAAILWTLGHFMTEIRYLIEHGAPRYLTPVLMLLAYVPPDLNLFNTRDRLATTSLSAPEAPVWVWLAYAALYAGAWLLAARHLLRKKEF
jgi:ABC-type transport system involved in multi-copper enzyme maturation permease subunit